MNNSFAPEGKEQRLFYAKLDDLEKRSRGGQVCHSSFMTPSESYKAEKYFEAKGNKDKICFFGGYFAAQRKQIFLLPEYLVESVTKDTFFDMLAEDFGESVRAIKVRGSGFRKLSHRDYLGSILSFGIERETIGDICILDDYSAIIFCNAEVEKYLSSVMESVGNDKVKLESTTVDINMPSTQKYQAFSDTVASERLDCVVASLCNLAREKGQNLIKGGLVEHNYETAAKIDTRVVAGDIISARGYGKFVIRDISQTTKKGRIRLLAEKYI